jgi:hypothetical protein
VQNVEILATIFVINMTQKISSNFKPREIIYTENSYITNKATRRCDAAAFAQNIQRCRDVLHIPECAERTKDEKRSRGGGGIAVTFRFEPPTVSFYKRFEK